MIIFSKNHFNKKGVRFFSFLLCLLFLFLSSGCNRNAAREFPVFEPVHPVTEESSEEEPEIDEPEGEKERPVLTVALPVSEEVMEKLVLLYTMKMGNFSGGYQSFLDDELEAFIEPLFSVTLFSTPDMGLPAETLLTQAHAGVSLPDIFYSETIDSLQKENLLLPLDSYLAGNPLFLSSQMFTPSLEACRVGKDLLGIPFRGSAKLLYLDGEILENAGLSEVPYLLDLNGFSSISEMVAYAPFAESQEEDGQTELSFAEDAVENWVIPFSDSSELLSFLPAAYTSQPGWFTHKAGRFHFQDRAFLDSVSFLRTYRQSLYSIDTFSEEQMEFLFPTGAPELSSHVAMWIGNSSDLNIYTRNGTRKISLSQIPSPVSGQETPPAVRVYPLCVSEKTAYPELSASFAAFLALDKDALLLQKDASEKPLFPLSSSEEVWDAFFEKSPHSTVWDLLRTKMIHAYYDPITSNQNLREKIDDLIFMYKELLLSKETELDLAIGELTEGEKAWISG